MTFKSLSEIESLVYRAMFYNEFLEEKLQESLDPIFNFPGNVPCEFYSEIKHLLFQVSGIDKSENFGYFFYEKMQDNPYPFCEDILKTATFTERYYNLHDKVLKSYIRSFLINNQIDPKIILEYDHIIPEGHGFHFFESFSQIENNRLKEPLPIPADFFKTLLYAINNDMFPMTQKKAACVVGYLNIERIMPVLIGKANALLNKPDIDMEKVMVLLHLLKSAQIIRPEAFNGKFFESVGAVINSTDNDQLFENYNSFKENYSGTLRSLADFL